MVAAFRLRATGVAQRHIMWRAQTFIAKLDTAKRHVLTKGVFVSFCGAEI